MKNISLYLDNSETKSLKIDLYSDNKILDRKDIKTEKSNTNLICEIENILHKNNLKISSISSIKVNPGPGSFTGLRVSASIANTLGLLLGIPVNDKEQVELIYN